MAALFLSFKNAFLATKTALMKGEHQSNGRQLSSNAVSLAFFLAWFSLADRFNQMHHQLV